MPLDSVSTCKPDRSACPHLADHLCPTHGLRQVARLSQAACVVGHQQSADSASGRCRAHLRQVEAPAVRRLPQCAATPCSLCANRCAALSAAPYSLLTLVGPLLCAGNLQNTARGPGGHPACDAQLWGGRADPGAAGVSTAHRARCSLVSRHHGGNSIICQALLCHTAWFLNKSLSLRDPAVQQGVPIHSAAGAASAVQLGHAN